MTSVLMWAGIGAVGGWLWSWWEGRRLAALKKDLTGYWLRLPDGRERLLVGYDPDAGVVDLIEPVDVDAKQLPMHGTLHDAAGKWVADVVIG